MIESYQLEIIRKRRSARVFWLIVLVCATMLYFFFQGYYPDVRLGLKRILSDSDTHTSSWVSDLIRSFGIINVKVTPADATITLGSGSYSNNEKRMSDYGEYMMSVSREGYVWAMLPFEIDREKPFLIEKLSLLPTPRYTLLDTASGHLALGKNSYLIQTSNRYIYSGASLRSPINYTGSLTSIGDGYLMSNTGILIWGKNKLERVSTDIDNFVNTCPRIRYDDGTFVCPATESILTKWGLYMTGVISYRWDLIEQSGSLSIIRDGIIEKTWKKKNTLSLNNISLIGSDLYSHSGWILTSIEKSVDTIITTLSTITYATLIDDDIYIIGSRDEQPYLVIRRIWDPISRIRSIALPSTLSYSDVDIEIRDGNIWIKTSGGIFFVYRGWWEINWIVEGEILSWDENHIFYRRDNRVWSAEWPPPTL